MNTNSFLRLGIVMVSLFLATSCASVDIPDGRTVKVPAATPPLDRFEALNEKRDPVTRVKLGRDMLVPQALKEDKLPDVMAGPYELRGETLASALQLILDDYDISLAFESDEGLTRRITVSNLHGTLKDVVNRVCSLADLYCHFEADTMTIKKTETFVVDLPPIGAGAAAATTTTDTAATATTGTTTNDAYTQIGAGLAAVIGTTPIVDSSTRVMIYTATQRSHKYALQYFERLRKNTALIIFETHIWEVALNNANRTGINWNTLFSKIGEFTLDVTVPGGVSAAGGATSPISITPTYTGSGNVTTDAVLDFISERGAVRTVSQPQITVLSGSRASLAVSQAENYVSGVSRTPSTTVGIADTFTTTTATVTTGLNMSVTSAWDQSTVYGNLDISLDDLLQLDSFSPDGGLTTVQLPQTTKRSLQTEIRVRPGDAILIGGLVSERDSLADSGPGFMKPLFATARNAQKANSELVFLLRPRVVAFIEGDDSDTPPVVDAPKEGLSIKSVPVPDITDNIKNIFGRTTAPAPAAAVSAAAPVVTPPPAAPEPPAVSEPPAVLEPSVVLEPPVVLEPIVPADAPGDAPIVLVPPSKKPKTGEAFNP